MKKIFIIFILLFTCFYSYSQELTGIFPGNKQKDIQNKLLAYGFEMSTRTVSGYTTEEYMATKRITYCDLPVSNILVIYDKSYRVSLISMITYSTDKDVDYYKARILNCVLKENLDITEVEKEEGNYLYLANYEGMSTQGRLFMFDIVYAEDPGVMLMISIK